MLTRVFNGGNSLAVRIRAVPFTDLAATQQGVLRAAVRDPRRDALDRLIGLPAGGARLGFFILLRAQRGQRIGHALCPAVLLGGQHRLGGGY